MENQSTVSEADVGRWHVDIVRRLAHGDRFAGLYGTALPHGCRLTAVLATANGFTAVQTVVRPDDDGVLAYPALTPTVLPAFWYERAAHDLSGVVPRGHPRLDPLLLPLHASSERPRPGGDQQRALLQPQVREGPVDVHGRAMFTIPFGPIRSGVTESIEFLIETPGEDIPHLNIRPHYKHRGIAKRFEGLSVQDAVLVAERVEGIASVAHALAFSHAAESMSGTVVSLRAKLLRVLYAELERITNHLDVAMRLADAAGLAVATSRFSWHKERVMRLVSRMCGNRFARNVVVPGGVTADPGIAPSVLSGELAAIYSDIRADADLVMQTPSFLDRLRGVGVLPTELARAWAAIGPIARASGIKDDSRWSRGTDAYPDLTASATSAMEAAGDAAARLRVRWSEIAASVQLISEVLARVAMSRSDNTLTVPVELPGGEAFGLGWSEAPQGETVYGLTIRDGLVLRCFARSASFHNLVTFHDVFTGDVLTDFAFIEASFGLSYAGVAM